MCGCGCIIKRHCGCVRAYMHARARVCMCICVNTICNLSLKLFTLCDVVKRVLICNKNICCFRETSLVKPDSVYAYYNAMLI